MFDLVVVRVIFILVLVVSAVFLRPFDLPWWQAGAGGLVLGAGIIFFEIRLELVSLKRLIGGACGSVMGILGAFLMSWCWIRSRRRRKGVSCNWPCCCG